MTHAPEPRSSSSPARKPAGNLETWWWRWEDESGKSIAQEPRQEFPSRADAESWLGEAFGELADEGVAAVTLFQDDREVYGPMSLSEA